MWLCVRLTHLCNVSDTQTAYIMSNKNIPQPEASKFKMGLTNKKDYTELHEKLKEYISQLKPDDVPSIVSASLYANVSENTVIKYEIRTTENSEVRQLLDKIRMLQKDFLIRNGLYNKINGPLTMRLLSAEHQINEKPQNLTQNNTFNISPELLAEAIEISRKKAPK